ncbi:MAG: flavoredoxin [Spirochaetales bacterium]|jgi:flavin reductase (DIM6/NTAB) family NADH-FMN oxidoreductase RutF|nr:flavoredoxin [Spirochaetales bacterium]
MFTEIDIATLELNPFTTIGEEGFLITAGDAEKWNTMTATWGFMGFIWRKPTYGIVVRNTRYTYQFLEEGEHFSVSLFPPQYKEALEFCGTHSGRDTDKMAATGLNVVSLDNYLTYSEANTVFCCRLASKTPVTPDGFIDPSIIENYKLGDYHTLYLGFVEKVLIKESP